MPLEQIVSNWKQAKIVELLNVYWADYTGGEKDPTGKFIKGLQYLEFAYGHLLETLQGEIKEGRFTSL